MSAATGTWAGRTRVRAASGAAPLPALLVLAMSPCGCGGSTGAVASAGSTLPRPGVRLA